MRTIQPEELGGGEIFIYNLLVRIYRIIVVIRWTGFAPWEFGLPFPGSITSTYLDQVGAVGRDRYGTQPHFSSSLKPEES